jgi:nucleoside 2-deoxyribosyltransferase
MKIYLAGQYPRRDEFRMYRDVLNSSGHEVTSNWLNEISPLNTKMGDDPDQFYLETAVLDFEDIDRADAILFMAEDPHVGIPRGGRHVEFGYAMGKGKKILVIGPKENVFHYIPGVKHYSSLWEFINEGR